MSETYYHSLAHIFSEKEFKAQVKLHKDKTEELFGVKPTAFRNTELLYDNRLAELIEKVDTDILSEVPIAFGLEKLQTLFYQLHVENVADFEKLSIIG